VQHLGVLEAAGIVTSTKVGRVRTYQLAPEALTHAAEWIGKRRLPAERRLDRLGAFLARYEDTSGQADHDEEQTTRPLGVDYRIAADAERVAGAMTS
jgi:hypothetical protein